MFFAPPQPRYFINFVASDGKFLPGKKDKDFDRKRIVYTLRIKIRRLTQPGKNLAVAQQMAYEIFGLTTRASCGGRIGLPLRLADLGMILGKAAQNLLNLVVERVKLGDKIFVASLQTIDYFTALDLIHGVPNAYMGKLPR
jgi:hypothetical protein